MAPFLNSESASRADGVRGPRRSRISFCGLLTASGVIASIATVMGYLGSFFWFFDLFSHFRVQLFATLFLAALLMLVRREFRNSAIFGAFVLLNLWPILPLYFGGTRAPITTSPSHRALLCNVETGFGDAAKVAGLIREVRPDIMILEEVSEKWLSAVAPSLDEYSYSRTMPRDDNFGIAFYSKFPLVNGEVRYIGQAEVPSVVAEIEAPDGRFTLIGTHPLPPASAENTRLRDGQLLAVPEVVLNATSPVLLLGDLNATPFCSAFRRLVREARLMDSSRGRGFQPTWPTFMPLVWIPIDHCLHDHRIHVSRRIIGPKVGSDHYPMIVDFVLEKP